MAFDGMSFGSNNQFTSNSGGYDYTVSRSESGSTDEPEMGNDEPEMGTDEPEMNTDDTDMGTDDSGHVCNCGSETEEMPVGNGSENDGEEVEGSGDDASGNILDLLKGLLGFIFGFLFDTNSESEDGETSDDNAMATEETTTEDTDAPGTLPYDDIAEADVSQFGEIKSFAMKVQEALDERAGRQTTTLENIHAFIENKIFRR